MVVTGGVLWWNDFICVACYNIVDQRDEVKSHLFQNDWCNCVNSAGVSCRNVARTSWT